MGAVSSQPGASDRAHVSSSTLASASAPPRRPNATMTTQWTITTRFSSRSIETPSSMRAARATRRASSTTRVILTVLRTYRTAGSSSRRRETFNQGPSSPMITATSGMDGGRRHGRSSTPAAAEQSTAEEPCSARIGGAAQRITDDGNGETGCQTKQDGLSLPRATAPRTPASIWGLSQDIGRYRQSHDAEQRCRRSLAAIVAYREDRSL